MKSLAKHHWIALFSLIALCSKGSAVGGGVSRMAGHMVTPKAMKNAARVGRRARDASLSLTVALKPRNQAALDDFTRRLYDPNDPLYQHFLSREEFRARFAPSDQEVEDIVSYLEMRGTHVSPRAL